MKQYIVCLLIVCLSLINGCVLPLGYSSPRHVKLAEKLMGKYSAEAQTKGLFLAGSGGAMMDDIQVISLDYISFEQRGVERARQLYVEVTEGLLQKINQNEEIRPYLHDYPCTIDNIKVSIAYRDANGIRLANGCVAYVFIGRNQTICYEAFDQEKDDFYSLHKESYEEAVIIVKNSS